MSRRADRLFRIVQLLRARRLVTASQLARELEVSPRTVYRDVRDLVDSGVPIRGEAGVGYQLQRGYDLPPMTFSAEEVEALVLGARLVQAWADPELAAAARSALGKVEAVLPPALRPHVLDSALFVPRKHQGRASEVMAPLRRAIAERRTLQLSYTRADGESSERVVWPLGLYFWNNSQTLGAWCALRQGYRNFRLDRIEALTALDEVFPADGDVCLKGYLEAMKREAQTRGATMVGWTGFGG